MRDAYVRVAIPVRREEPNTIRFDFLKNFLKAPKIPVLSVSLSLPRLPAKAVWR